MCASALPQENGGLENGKSSTERSTEEDEGLTQLESLCMECRENGTTTILMTQVPHFRELVIYSFECPHCGNRNNEVQFAGTFGEQGVRYNLSVPAQDLDVLSRQVVKSDSATVFIPELEFEIPAQTQKGTITTLEGLLSDASSNLAALQPERRAAAPEAAAAIDTFLEKLNACSSGQQAFTVELDDPAGNSYIESPDGNVNADHALTVIRYERTREQARAIGLSTGEQGDKDAEEAAARLAEIDVNDPHHGVMPRGAAAAHAALARLQGPSAEALLSRYTAPEEVLEMPGSCSACGAIAPTRMYRTSIPFFKEVIIMCNSCDACGYKNSEVKGAGGISPQGRRIKLHVQEQDDLRRDVIKAETASLSVPELDLEVTTGVFGGLITTVEGLVAAVRDSLQRMHAFQLGDSAGSAQRSQWRQFFASLDACIALDRPWTLVLADPLANTFVAPVGEKLEDDPRLTMEDYERTEEEDEEYGIDHLRTMESID